MEYTLIFSLHPHNSSFHCQNPFWRTIHYQRHLEISCSNNIWKKKILFSPIIFCSRCAAEKTGRGESGKIQEREEKMQCLQYYITPHHLSPDKCQVYLRKCKRLWQSMCLAASVFNGHCSLQSHSSCFKWALYLVHRNVFHIFICKFISMYFYVQSYCPLNISIYE